jgi:hypothetical protein
MRSTALDAGCCSRFFRPRLDVLEDRIYPGDTILGLCAAVLLGQSRGSLEPGAHRVERASERNGSHSSVLGATDSLSAIFAREPFQDTDELEAGAVLVWGRESISELARPAFSDDAPAWQGAVQHTKASALPILQAASSDVSAMPGYDGGRWSDISASLIAFGFAGNAAQYSPQLFAASHRGSISFDPATGQLAIQSDPGDHTVRETVADGFLEVTLDGQLHSSNPRSGSFDSALTGASAATIASIRYEGGSQDTLTLGSQRLAGTLTIQAPNITVRGALQASSVRLAAPGWVTVDAAGRIDGMPSQVRAGSVSDPRTIDVSAGIFVNSGQLHADGLSGGQISIQAGKILDAGPITANSTNPGGNGGQVHLAFTDAYLATTAAVLSASSAAGSGGHLTIDGGKSGHPQFDLIDPHPTAGSRFGNLVYVLSSGNIVVTNPGDDFGGNAAGAVYLFDGRSGALISSLAGNHSGDQIGSPGVVLLSNGNYVVASPSWNGARGAATWGSGTAGVSGAVSDSNSLVGSTAGDFVSGYISGGGPRPVYTYANIAALHNGNYIVASYYWNNVRGALTWGNGSTGVTGPVSDANSLVGTNRTEGVGYLAFLTNGNYVVFNRLWNGNRGAVTWGDGNAGVTGTVSAANSLVGSNPGDYVGSGRFGYDGFIPLSNGNYLVESPGWKGHIGAVTWGDGSKGCAVRSPPPIALSVVFLAILWAMAALRS